VLGPLHLGSGLVHVGRFSPAAVAAALSSGGTMLFGVPTMYHRLAESAADDPAIAPALAGARLLVSGSAALARRDAHRIQALTGRTIVERYGLTETLIVCATPAGRNRPGTVGPAVPGVELRLVDEHGAIIDAPGIAGGVEVRGPCLFDGYLDQPEATGRAVVNGWFRTGDTAERTAEGDYRIVGRTSLDIIKTGGFKVGAGEIEDVLRQHPDVGDAAVLGEADPDLGQRIVAYIEAAPGAAPAADALAAFVAAELAPHKRPRRVHIVDCLPRTPLGKIEKRRLVSDVSGAGVPGPAA
jgi:malonyl-CoA/methylmalonyl-CoA synthetase